MKFESISKAFLFKMNYFSSLVTCVEYEERV